MYETSHIYLCKKWKKKKKTTLINGLQKIYSTGNL